MYCERPHKRIVLSSLWAIHLSMLLSDAYPHSAVRFDLPRVEGLHADNITKVLGQTALSYRHPDPYLGNDRRASHW